MNKGKKTHNLSLKAIRVTLLTWIVDPFTKVKPAGAFYNLKSMYKTSMKQL